ncbi:LOW QUALITY PROTEIN: cell surface glycoprotein CD200 receptor 1 [Hippopotamus amphibius kiboko]|uniref:LOW QUALITY PROTEIN: cell surface glycoprotein CD200 receptor 1 n=1 Tax=Hippopotamus amphibius kiboko TaxID=575201 RepID=UPI00259285D7|nr:LOW QUALITY PROTEIN: cell surface glycoprotein CD200 receptor 1 [Hippopotamus amphibius kiboko]
MHCPWITSDLQLLLILTLFLVVECISTGMEVLVTSNNSLMQSMGKDNGSWASTIISSTADRKQSTITPLAEVIRSLFGHEMLRLEYITEEADDTKRRGEILNVKFRKNKLHLNKNFVARAGSVHVKLMKSLTLYVLPVNTSLLVLVDTKAMLSCPAVLWTSVLLATWEIVLRDKPPCLRAFRSDTNETTGGNCTDKRITWASGLDKNPALHIDPVAITHDGYYRCQIVMPAGNFHHGYNLQVLVPPEVTLVQTENGTAVCKAFAGKPAAQISWTPEGDCVTEQEPYWGNDTVTVQSTCRWEDRHVPNVSCSISHLTGNRSLSIELNQGAKTPSSGILSIISPVFIILVIVGSIWLLKISGCRKCKLKKTEPTPVVEEDEMQPYASYTEKNNPLYDTTDRVKTSPLLQNEVDGMSLHTVYVSGM